MHAKLVRLFLLASVLTFPSAASAQIGVGVRVGTLGLAGDAALAVGGNAQIRGGIGIMPIEPSLSISDFDATVELPSSFITLGLDFFPTGSGFRIGGGLLLKPDDPSLTADCSGTIDIGDQTYDCAQVGTATASVDSKSSAPYVMIGFGKIASSGIGFFLDLGAAFVGESDLTLSVDGPISGNAQFRDELLKEERDWEDTINDYKVYPIVNIGLRVGIGS